MRNLEWLLVRQIRRLCEKQYRKGFQQGFEACRQQMMSANKVAFWRTRGAMDDYRFCYAPQTGAKLQQNDLLLAEMRMPAMSELKDLFERANEITKQKQK